MSEFSRRSEFSTLEGTEPGLPVVSPSPGPCFWSLPPYSSSAPVALQITPGKMSTLQRVGPLRMDLPSLLPSTPSTVPLVLQPASLEPALACVLYESVRGKLFLNRSCRESENRLNLRQPDPGALLGGRGSEDKTGPVQRWAPFIRSGGGGAGELGRRLKRSVFGKDFLYLFFRIHLLGDRVTVICNWHLVSTQKGGRR